MEVLGLWDSFSNRVSTIYLPDKRRPMLPTCLSECLCSLVEKQVRFAFTCEMRVTDDTIVERKYYIRRSWCIKILDTMNRNWMGSCPIKIFSAAISLKNKYRGINYIRGSHDIVNYLMVLMNNFCGNEMIQNKNGVYRCLVANDPLAIPDNLTEDATSFLQYWNTNGGQYVPYSNEIRHDIMKLHNYIHITSPIRRLVDLLNMTQLQMNMNLIDFGDGANKFLAKWLGKLDYINKTTRAVRKVQNDLPT